VVEGGTQEGVKGECGDGDGGRGEGAGAEERHGGWGGGGVLGKRVEDCKRLKIRGWSRSMR